MQLHRFLLSVAILIFLFFFIIINLDFFMFWDMDDLGQPLHTRYHMHIARQCIKNSPKHNLYHQSYAIISLLTSENYVDLSIILGKSISHYSDVPCHVSRVLMIRKGLILKHRDIELLSKSPWQIKYVDPIPFSSTLLSTMKHRRYEHTLLKLHILGMTEYDCILFLDSDTMVTGNIMELFEQQMPTMLKQGRVIAWSRDLGPQADCKYSSGVMMVLPSRSLSEQVLYFLSSYDSGLKYGEQSLLNSFFSSREDEVLELNPKFNTLATIPKDKPMIWQRIKTDVRIFHFIFFKPNYPFFMIRCMWHGTQNFCKLWLDLAYLYFDFDKHYT